MQLKGFRRRIVDLCARPGIAGLLDLTARQGLAPEQGSFYEMAHLTRDTRSLTYFQSTLQQADKAPFR